MKDEKEDMMEDGKKEKKEGLNMREERMIGRRIERRKMERSK